MNNKIFIPQKPANSKPLHLDQEIKEIRSILEKLEKQISGQPVNEVCRKLIKRSVDQAAANLKSTLHYKKISDEDKRK